MKRWVKNLAARKGLLVSHLYKRVGKTDSGAETNMGEALESWYRETLLRKRQSDDNVAFQPVFLKTATEIKQAPAPCRTLCKKRATSSSCLPSFGMQLSLRSRARVTLENISRIDGLSTPTHQGERNCDGCWWYSKGPLSFCGHFAPIYDLQGCARCFVSMDTFLRWIVNKEFLVHVLLYHDIRGGQVEPHDSARGRRTDSTGVRCWYVRFEERCDSLRK